jgi:hypothetical protein
MRDRYMRPGGTGNRPIPMLLLEEVFVCLAILAILSNVTALLRLRHVYVETKG